MAELVDAADSKSAAHKVCRFDSCSGHITSLVSYDLQGFFYCWQLSFVSLFTAFFGEQMANSMANKKST